MVKQSANQMLQSFKLMIDRTLMLVHTLKGLAGSIGAKQVQADAVQLNCRCMYKQDRENRQEVQSHVERFCITRSIRFYSKLERFLPETTFVESESEDQSALRKLLLQAFE